jgi:putative membrane protein
MIHADQRFSEAVEQAVAELEERTDAEVVVVAAEQSGSYADLAHGAGATAAFLTFLALLMLPFPVHPFFATADLLGAYLIVRWMAGGAPVLARFAGEARCEAQVRRAASAEFHLEAVHATPRRTGLLVYVSAWEKRVELIPDVGLEAAVPRPEWAKAAELFRHDDLDHFLQGLSAVGDLLAEHLPRSEGQRVDLPNAPRVRA